MESIIVNGAVVSGRVPVGGVTWLHFLIEQAGRYQASTTTSTGLSLKLRLFGPNNPAIPHTDLFSPEWQGDMKEGRYFLKIRGENPATSPPYEVTVKKI
jgi:hypothetical protein